MKMFYVYVYRDPRPGKDDCPIYVGKGKRATGRLKRHWQETVKGIPHRNVVFRRVLDKINNDGLKPSIKIAKWFRNEERAFAYEQKLIKRFGRRCDKTGTLCNLTDGGEGACGRTITDKVREASSRTHAGKILSRETRRKISQSLTGKRHTAATKRKISATQRNRFFTPLHRKRISQSLTGKPLSDEHRAKLKEAWKTRPPMTEETRMKRSLAQQARRERERLQREAG